MESGTSDQTIIPNQKADESSMVFDLSIQASPHRTSSIISENIAIGDDQSARMEPSFLIASSKKSEITEVEDDPSLTMETSLQTASPMLDHAEDKQCSGTGSISSPQMKVNPFMKDLSAKYDKEDLLKCYCELKHKLEDGLQKEAMYAFLEHNMMEAQEKVQELFYLFEAIKFVNSQWRDLLKTNRSITDEYRHNFKADYDQTDIYYHLFVNALSYATELQENPSVGLTHSDFTIVANLSKYFEAIDFMIFLINFVPQEDIMAAPSFVLRAKTLVTEYIHRYEEETISTFICLVVNDEDGEAKDLFERLLKHLKPSDIINRGRVYNDALQKAQDLCEVHTFLSSPSLSPTYKFVVQCNDRLTRLAMEYDNQVKVHKLLVDLYLSDVALNQKIDWEFVEQHDYPYLIKCVWECHKRVVPNDIKHYNWTLVQRIYVFTSSVAITVGGQDIMKHLLEAWPTLVNTSYKGVAALHIAVLKRNEEVIKFLLNQEELDINVRTGRLLTEDDFKFGDKRNLSLGKKWNKNRWKLPTYQTALHMATSQGDLIAVQLLCDVPEPHQKRLRCHEEDDKEHTPLDILYIRRQNEVAENFDISEIERILLSKSDVQNGIARLYQYRQVLVDAVNTILVGAALIASVTFVGWLQPPLGFVQDYDLAMPYPAPPNTYDSYLAVQGNMGVKAFALFNSLSFFFAIATVIIGADAAFPIQRYQYIGDVVRTMHLLLRRAIKLLIISLVCVLGAFGSAAIAVLPPSLFFRKDLVLSIIIGGGVCGFVLWQLLSRHSTKVQWLNAFIAYYIDHIIKFANVFWNIYAALSSQLEDTPRDHLRA